MTSPTPARNRKSSRVSIDEISRVLLVSRPTVYDLLRRGVIPNVRTQRLYIVARPAFEKWLETCGM